jgi:hypothetical protein
MGLVFFKGGLGQGNGLQAHLVPKGRDGGTLKYLRLGAQRNQQLSSPESPTNPRPPSALQRRRPMDRFHDRHHVRLRSLVHRTYLHAADDGESVTLSQVHGSLNAAWAVHIYNGGDDDGVGCDYDGGQRLLLHSAAYGRYLAATATPARLGHRGLRAELRDYDQPGVEAVMWQAVGSGFGDDVVLLRNVGGRYLRANGRYLPWNSSGVSVDDEASSMMYWVVEPIPAREDMPALPAPPPVSLP